VRLTGKHRTNLTFGGPDGKTVFVTQADGGYVESFRVERPGREPCLQRRAGDLPLGSARDGNTVFMACTLHLTSRARGRSITQPFAKVLRFKGDRLIDGTPFYYDTAAVTALLRWGGRLLRGTLPGRSRIGQKLLTPSQNCLLVPAFACVEIPVQP
jgi:hypothetical protein